MSSDPKNEQFSAFEMVILDQMTEIWQVSKFLQYLMER